MATKTIILTKIFKPRKKTYMMVLMLSLLQTMNPSNGKARVSEVKHFFRHYYQHRERLGLVIDDYIKGMESWKNVTPGQVNEILEKPVEVLNGSGVLRGGTRREEWVGFSAEVWKGMTDEKVKNFREFTELELRDELNELWKKKHFSLREDFGRVFQELDQARTEHKFRTALPVVELLEKTLPNRLCKLDFIQDRYVLKSSVGKVAWAHFPWIAFMNRRLTTNVNEGVYVCYVFSKDLKSVYLTFKHSDEVRNNPKKKQGRVNIKSAIERIRSQLDFTGFATDDLVNIQNDYSSGNYLVGTIAYKKYDRDNLPSDEELFSDLNKLLGIYEGYVDGETLLPREENEEEVDDVEPIDVLDFDVKNSLWHIQNFIQTAGFTYPTHLIENFYLSLKSKPFTILAGISGTGKTKLVKLFAEALGATRDNGQFVLIPVRPDWNDPADLIGYTDLSGKFRPGELTKVLREAADPLNFCKPYFICLDEMNLARVEHYFSDLLSIMETQEWELDENGEKTGRILTNDVVRYAETNATGDPCEVRLHLPENVFLIGTVNMDETTHPFSKKVLDRANTIEFQHIELTNLAGLDTPDGSRPEAVHVHQSFLRGEYLCLQDAWGEHSELIRQTSEQLEQVNAILQSIHAHVGYRVRDAVCFYLIYNQRFDLLPSDVAFDLQLTQKILPRIQGSSRSVQGVLVELMKFAAKDGHKAKMKAEELDNDASLLYALVHKSKDDDSFEQHMRYPISARKIAFMLRRFDEDGFTSYWLS